MKIEIIIRLILTIILLIIVAFNTHWSVTVVLALLTISNELNAELIKKELQQ